MFNFLNSLFPHGTKIPGRMQIGIPTIKYGIKAKISMWVETAMGKTIGTRPNAFLGNTASLLGLAEGKLIQDTGIFDGMNAAIIGAQGTPDANLAQNEMAKLHLLRAEIYKHRELVEDGLDKVNVSGVLYNMLRMFLIKSYGHLRYDPKGNYYDNGHVAVSNAMVFGDGDACKLGNAVNFEDTPSVVYTKDPSVDATSMLFYDMGIRVSAATVTVMKFAHAQWTSRAPFLLAHPSPKLAEDFIFVNGHPKGDPLDWADLTPNMIKSVIGDFVKRHAAYRDFEVAYAMVTGIMTMPVARSAEAILWNKVVLDVSIARPVCIRGLVPEFYMGTQYVRSPDWQDTFASWFNSPTAILGHSIAMLEAVYTELFHLTRVSAKDDIDITNVMYKATGEMNVPNTGLLVDVMLTCLRYGKEVVYPYTVRCGVDRMSAIPSLTVDPPSVIVKDEKANKTYDIGAIVEGIAPLNIHAYAPVTYPSLTYGINEDQYYYNGTREEVVIPLKGDRGVARFSQVREFSQFMSMMRLFGYDVTAIRAYDQKHIRNWSDNASGRYIYVHDPEDVCPGFAIKMNEIKKRENCWIDMPAMFGEVRAGYELSEIRMQWLSGNEVIGLAETPAMTVNRREMEQAVAKLTQARPTIRITPLIRKSDFMETRYSLPGSRPTVVPESSAVIGPPTDQTGSIQEQPADVEGM